MALQFPASPVDGQIYFDTASGNRYVYDAATTKWSYTANNTPTGSVYLSASAPPGAVAGDLWWHQDLGTMFIFYNDGDSTQWVETSPSGGFSDVAASFQTINAAFGVANAAFDSANNVAPQVAPSYNTANAAYTQANAAYSFANGVATNAAAAFAAANAEYTFSNTVYAAVNSAFAVINAAYTSSNADYVVTNAAFAVANAAYGTANLAYTVSNSAFGIANIAFTYANNKGYYAGNNGDKGNSTSLGDIFRVHSNTLTQNVTIYSGNNALCAGPITVTGSSTTLTIQPGARLAIV